MVQLGREAVDGAGVVAEPVVEATDQEVRIAEAVAGIAQPRPGLREELRRGELGVLLDEGLELGDCGSGLGLVPFGTAHLVEIDHAQLQLGLRGQLVRGRVQAEELAELGQRREIGDVRALAFVRLDDAQPGLGAQGTLRIVVPDLDEVLAGGRPCFLGQRLRAAVEQNPVGVRLGESRNHRIAAAASRQRERGGDENRDDRRSDAGRVHEATDRHVASHWYSA